MKSDLEKLGQLIIGMRAAYLRGENSMTWARANNSFLENSITSTLVAYDLQAGSYIGYARQNTEFVNDWCIELSDILSPLLKPGDRILEVGVGEATTLVGVLNAMQLKDVDAFGFDVSWSRINFARKWSDEHSVKPTLFVGDLFHIPLADNSIDVVYTSHSLEPNGGREEPAIAELLRVARKTVVLVEPIYELASEDARQRMTHHGYVKNLKVTAENLGGNVVDYRLLDVCGNPLNPSGVIVINKINNTFKKTTPKLQECSWQCPITGTLLVDDNDVFFAKEVGIVYPVIRGIPMLRAEHAAIASRLNG